MSLRWCLEPDLLSLPRLPGPLLMGEVTTFPGIVVSSTGNGGGGGDRRGGRMPAMTGGARRSNISLWYFCKHKKDETRGFQQ